MNARLTWEKLGIVSFVRRIVCFLIQMRSTFSTILKKNFTHFIEYFGIIWLIILARKITLKLRCLCSRRVVQSNCYHISVNSLLGNKFRDKPAYRNVSLYHIWCTTVHSYRIKLIAINHNTNVNRYVGCAITKVLQQLSKFQILIVKYNDFVLFNI